MAWGDYNNDGYVDIVVGGGLWKNNAGTGFTSTEYSFAEILWADYDNDGLIDVYGWDSMTLYQNQSTPSITSFSAVPFPALPTDDHRSLGASWADYNNDARVDLYVGGYERWGEVPAYWDVVVKNQGISFTYTDPDDLYNYQPARGITSADFDRDGDQDVYVSNYRLVANLLLQNDGYGNFTDVAPAYNAQAGSGHSIGAAWGDFNNDGNFDLFAGNFSHPGQPQSRFLENLGPAAATPYSFDDKGTGGVAWQESYASPALGDYDNDGDLDLFFTTVYPGNSPVLYRNEGDWNFTDVTAAEGLANLGPTYEAGWADFDNDGDLDLATDGKIFVNNESDTGTNHWLKVKLTGDGRTVNGAAIGTEVRINVGGQILTRQVEGGTGEGNQNDLTLHFGLGSHDGPVDLEITAGGKSTIIRGVEVDQTVAYTVSGGGPPSSLWTVGWELLLPATADLYPYGIQMQIDEPGGATVLSQTSGTTGNHRLEHFQAEGEGVYTWLHPSNNHPLVGPTIIGMAFDAPVEPLLAFTTNEAGEILLALPATSAAEFKHTGLPDDDVGPWLKLSSTFALEPEVLEEGILLGGSEDAPSELTGIMLADVSGQGLGLGDLNDDLLDIVGGINLCTPCLGDIILGADGIDHVLAFTDGSDLTAEMLADPSIAFHILDRPDLLGYDELLVVLESEALVGGNILQHRSFSLLGRTITVPEPATLGLLALAGLTLLRRRRK